MMWFKSLISLQLREQHITVFFLFSLAQFYVILSGATRCRYVYDVLFTPIDNCPILKPTKSTLGVWSGGRGAFIRFTFFLFADLFWFHSHMSFTHWLGFCTENYLVRFKNNVQRNIHNINSAHYKRLT